MLAGVKLARRSQVRVRRSVFLLLSFPLRCHHRHETDFLFSCSWWARITVKYFSPMTNLCIVRVARGTAASTTWAALVLLDRVSSGGGGQGQKVIPHVIHVSGASLFPSLGVWNGNKCGFPALGTLKHAQIAAVEWNREAIARVKAGIVDYGMSSCLHLPIYTWLTIDGFCWAH